MRVQEYYDEQEDLGLSTEPCHRCGTKGEIWVAVKGKVEKQVCPNCQGSGYTQEL